MNEEVAAVRALEKALAKVEDQQGKVAAFAVNDPQRDAELKILETLRQGASLARMACLFSQDDEPARREARR